MFILQCILTIVSSLSSAASAAAELKVSPVPSLIRGGSLGGNLTLRCSSSLSPILCLWKTPYGHVYTLSEGVAAESGRLHYLPYDGCALKIVGLARKDSGRWECEVGAVVQDDFRTQSADINVQVNQGELGIYLWEFLGISGMEMTVSGISWNFGYLGNWSLGNFLSFWYYVN